MRPVSMSRSHRRSAEVTYPLASGLHDVPCIPDRGCCEAELLAGLRCGRLEAVAQAYDLHQAALRAFVGRYLGDPSLAEDVVHDVFVELPRLVFCFRGEASLRTFLFSVALNRARHVLRSRLRRENTALRASEASTPDPVTTPDQHLDRKRLSAALVQALDALPPDQREAFLLCEVEEHASREVAAIVGAPEGTVRTRLFHARKKLRDWLSQALGLPEGTGSMAQLPVDPPATVERPVGERAPTGKGA